MGVLDGEALRWMLPLSRLTVEGTRRIVVVDIVDIDARLRKQGRNVTLGYGVHLAVDAGSEMPLVAIVKPANVNEKKLSTSLLHKSLGVSVK